jgi:hypothetical protein
MPLRSDVNAIVDQKPHCDTPDISQPQHECRQRSDDLNGKPRATSAAGGINGETETPFILKVCRFVLKVQVACARRQNSVGASSASWIPGAPCAIRKGHEGDHEQSPTQAITRHRYRRGPNVTPLVIFTIGHSTRAIEDFIRLLNAHRVQRVIDVRTDTRTTGAAQACGAWARTLAP